MVNLRTENQVVTLVEKIYAKKGMTLQIEKACNFAIKENNPSFCYKLARILYKEEVMKRLQEAVINSNKEGFCYLFATYVKKADINKLQQAVINSKNPEYCYNFARDVKHANAKDLQQVVINSKNPKYCYEFAKDVKNADINALLKVVIECGELRYCLRFARDVKKAGITEMRMWALVNSRVNKTSTKTFSLEERKKHVGMIRTKSANSKQKETIDNFVSELNELIK